MKVVESDHTPLAFTIPINTSHENTGCIRPKPANTSPHNQRFYYVFDMDRLPDYVNSLKSDPAQDKLFSITESISENVGTDVVICSTYDYLKYSIESTFKKKYLKPATNTFPVNNWYDDECKDARKAVNNYANL